MRRRFLVLLAVLCSALVLPPAPGLVPPAEAKVYIDIERPGISTLPIAVQGFTGNSDLSDIVKNDLTATGLFTCIDEAAHIEKPDQPFSAGNWRGLGVELVVKGAFSLASPQKAVVVVSAYDVAAGSEVFKKEYSAGPDLLRPLAHAVANDIYALLTGKQGVFRTKIAFVGERGGKKELYTMDWDGYRARGLGITGGILLAPRWSSDGSALLYSAERQRQWGLFLLDMKSLKERPLALPKSLALAGNFFPGNREYVFASSRDGNTDIYRASIDSPGERKIVSSPWIDVSPAVSSDGRSIVFTSNRAGNPHIYVADSDGYGVRRVSFEGAYNTSPTWSPAGDRIAFVGRAGGKNQLFIVKPDGSGLTQLTSEGNNEDPSFSPDGRFIAFTSDRDGSKGVYLIRTNGEGALRLSPKGLKAANPGWSP